MSPSSALIRWAMTRWLALANGSTALFLGLPFLAPVLARLGRADLAHMIYAAYQVTCHEWPFRAYFLFGSRLTYSAAELRAAGVPSIYTFHGSPELGYTVAFCQRNVAIYAAILLAGIAYACLGRRAHALSLGAYLFAIAPMALDGVTQLVGWRESSWELRTVTGVLFGWASVWLLYPRVAAFIDDWLRTRRASGAAACRVGPADSGQDRAPWSAPGSRSLL